MYRSEAVDIKINLTQPHLFSRKPAVFIEVRLCRALCPAPLLFRSAAAKSDTAHFCAASLGVIRKKIDYSQKVRK